MLINQSGKLMSDTDLNDYDSIIFYGASTRNAAAIDKLGVRNRVRYVVDSNAKREGESIDGFKIYSTAVLEKEKKALILTVLEKYAEDIIKSVRQYANCEVAFFIPGECNLKSIKEGNEIVLEKLTYKKYIHIFPDEKFLYFFYTMLEDYFNVEEHLFIIDYNRIDLMENQYHNLEYACEKNAKYNNILLMKDFDALQNIISEEYNCNEMFLQQKVSDLFVEAKKVILHSVALSNNVLKFVQSMIKNGNGKKMIWMCWGGDTWFKEDSFVATEILQKISYGIAIEEYIKRIPPKCNIEMKPTYVSYYDYIPSRKVKKELETADCGKQLNVLLGHFASELNNLEYGLDVLYKFHKENIKIYCTLSYGVESYREKIIKKGTEMFGNKFIPIVDYMEFHEYWDFLTSMNVVVFPMVRLAGLTTLFYLDILGKKIYMLKEMADALLNEEIYVEDIAKIEGQEWGEFADYSDVSLKDGALQKLNNKTVLFWQAILS